MYFKKSNFELKSILTSSTYYMKPQLSVLKPNTQEGYPFTYPRKVLVSPFDFGTERRIVPTYILDLFLPPSTN